MCSLRREAAAINARRAHVSASYATLRGLRTQLCRSRQLLELVKRREKLKLQLSYMRHVEFEQQVIDAVAG